MSSGDASNVIAAAAAHADDGDVEPFVRSAARRLRRLRLLPGLGVSEKIAGTDQTRQAGGLFHEIAAVETSHGKAPLERVMDLCAINLAASRGLRQSANGDFRERRRK
jgi:hypothetical protein